MSVMYVCVYVCTYSVLYTYIVCMNVAIYVCNPSNMLKAQSDGTKVFKHPAQTL